MALVKCAECNHSISNKARICLYCGYEPKGNCKRCRHYISEPGREEGICGLAKNDYVREDKAMCPGVIKKYWCEK